MGTGGQLLVTIKFCNENPDEYVALGDEFFKEVFGFPVDQHVECRGNGFQYWSTEITENTFIISYSVLYECYHDISRFEFITINCDKIEKINKKMLENRKTNRKGC